MATPETKVLSSNRQFLSGQIDNSVFPPRSKLAYLEQKSTLQKFGGLKRNLWIYLSVAIFVFSVCFIYLLVVLIFYHVEDGYGVLFHGNCTNAERANTWFHLGINVLSTLLLLASDAYLKAASAPTRQDIQEAHSKSRWLSLGLLSFRNINVSWRSRTLCALLAATSLPFHLLFNSVIFPSFSTNEYYWAIASNDFLNGAPFNLTEVAFGDSWFNHFIIGAIFDYADTSTDLQHIIQGLKTDWHNAYGKIQHDASKYELLGVSDCLQAYTHRILPDRRSLVLITPLSEPGHSILGFDVSTISSNGHHDPLSWICSELDLDSLDSDFVPCDPTPFLQNPQSWQPFGAPVERCLSEKVDEQCSVKFSIVIAICVLCCNVLKIAIMVYFLQTAKLEDLMVCDGDALASFLQQEDDLLPKDRILSLRNSKSAFKSSASDAKPLYHTRKQYFAFAVSPLRWCILTLSGLITLGAVVGLYIYMIQYGLQPNAYPTSLSSLWNMGFGVYRLNPHLLVFSSQSFLPTVTPISLTLLSNLPQLILGWLFYNYASVLAAMASAHDFSRFVFQSQTLRVSSPVGQQRSTWLLGQPLCTALPFLTLQILLHWLVSQSIYFVQIASHDPNGLLLPGPPLPPDQNLPSGFGHGIINNCAYSPVAVLFATVTHVVAMACVVGLALRRTRKGAPPIVASCSVALASACRPPWRLRGMQLRRLRWCRCPVHAYDEGDDQKEKEDDDSAVRDGQEARVERREGDGESDRYRYTLAPVDDFGEPLQHEGLTFVRRRRFVVEREVLKSGETEE